jgi:hypothetical protein
VVQGWRILALSRFCLDRHRVTALLLPSRGCQIAGFAAGSQPGVWSVRVISNGKTLAASVFRITGEPSAVRVTSVHRSSTASGMELTLEGVGFEAESMVHIAQYTARGGWHYISAAQPRTVTANQLVAEHPKLTPR